MVFLWLSYGFPIILPEATATAVSAVVHPRRTRRRDARAAMTRLMRRQREIHPKRFYKKNEEKRMRNVCKSDYLNFLSYDRDDVLNKNCGIILSIPSSVFF